MSTTQHGRRNIARLLGPPLALLAACAHSGAAPLPRTANPGVDATVSTGQLREVTPGNLLVFVGRRISIREVPPPEGEVWLDRKFQARYAVLSVVYGTFPKPEVDFVALDHKVPSDTLPGFARNDVALLYVSKEGDQLVHEKYQYDDVFPTRDGRWGLCGDPQPPNGPSRLKPHPIEFKDRAGSKAGFYADELFELRKRDVLRARGLFQ